MIQQTNQVDRTENPFRQNLNNTSLADRTQLDANNDTNKTLNIVDLSSVQQKPFQSINKYQIQSSQHLKDVSERQQLIYPVLSVVACPRVFEQKIRDDKVPLSRYTEKIYACNCKKSYQEHLVRSCYLKKFKEQDGMIYNLKDMRRLKQLKKSEFNDNLKILICICVYNESMDALNLTLQGIYQNLQYFQKIGYSQGDIAVVIMQDGILKLVEDRQTRTFTKGAHSLAEFYALMDEREGKQKCDLKERINIILDEMDNYQRKGMGQYIKRNYDFPPSIERNSALLYQNLWHPEKTKRKMHEPQTANTKISQETLKTQQNINNQRRLRIFSCFKHINGTKLSSHLWFFEGFCRYIRPKFCVLLDVGTKPHKKGLVNLISGFNHPNIGGVTGFLTIDANFKSEEGQNPEERKNRKQEQAKSWIKENIFSIEKAQEYQYIISHFIDKNSQSALGFLHVLPGAWSAYRYKALIKTDRYEANLLERSYFKMLLNPTLQDKDYRQANMYLAEDRILSLGIYCQKQCNYTLKYVPDAVAFTDPMKDHQNLMIQRRRWINSSLFAFLYVFRNYYFNAMESSHNYFRKYVTLNISMFIPLFSLLNTYLTPSLYFFVLYATVLQLGGYGSGWQHIAKIAGLIQCLTFIASVGGALMGKQWSQRAEIISYILSAYTFLLIFLIIVNVFLLYVRVSTGILDITNLVVISLVIMLILNLTLMFIVFCMHLITHRKYVLRLFYDSASYLAYQGAYSQVMVAYSFCNIDDVSWGTKGSSNNHGGPKKKYQVQKVFFVSQWLFYNALATALFIYIDIVIPSRTLTGGGIVLLFLAMYASIFLTLKIIFAVYYHFKWVLTQKCSKRPEQSLQRKSRIDQYWNKHELTWKQFENKDNFKSVIYRR